MKKIKKRFHSLKSNAKLTGMVMFLIILALIFFIVNQSLHIIQLKYEIADITDVKNDYQNNYKLLQEQIDQTETNSTIEEKARERLGMVKTGETPVRVTEVKPEETDTKPLKVQEKTGIYLKDWFQWVEFTIKKGNKG